jgi:CRP-like cAMP-binding protein
MSIPSTPAQCSNFLLSHLPEEEYRRLSAHFELVATPFKSVFYREGQLIEYVYFPLSGQEAALAAMRNGNVIEVATIGNEGFSPIEVLAGSEAALENVICKISGEALKLPRKIFMASVQEKTMLHLLVYRYFQAYLALLIQGAACNQFHTTEERVAKWILRCHDRSKTGEINVTQGFLAEMLGVHRPSISLIVKRFQERGLIKYAKGAIVILDRAGLESASCECYDVVKKRSELALDPSRQQQHSNQRLLA